MNTWPKVRLGELMRQVERPTAVDTSRLYRLLGVRWYGQGLFVREELFGHQIAADKVYEVRSGDFVYNRLFAWKGSFAVADATADRCHVSNEFPCFSVDTRRLDVSYLRWWFQRETAWTSALGLSSGATPTSRNRLKEAAFLSLELGLPPLPEQQRIVARIEGLASQLQQASDLRSGASTALASLRARVQQSAFSGAATGKVSDFVRFQTGYAFKSEWFADTGIRLARNANVGHGHLNWAETVRISADRRAEFPGFELQEGDILLALDRPLISTGVKVARVIASDLPALLLQRVARARFVDARLSPSYFFRWLQSPLFAGSIDPGRSNGVPHISHKDVESLPIHVPPLAEQQRIVNSLEAAEGEMSALEDMQTQTRAELNALLPAILDRAFAGAL